MALREDFLVVLTLVVFLVALARPHWGLLATAFWYFFRPDTWYATWLLPVLYWTIATLVGWAITKYGDKSFRHSLWMAALLVMMLVATAIGTYVDDRSWAALRNIAKIFVFVFLIVRLCDTPRRLAALAVAMLLGCLWVSKAILYNWGAAGFSGTYRADCPVVQGGGANYTALFFAGTLPLLVLGLMRPVKWLRYGSAALLPIWLAVMVATGSRGGFLAMTAGIIVVLVCRRKPWLVIATGVLAVGLMLAAPAEYWNRIGTITAEERERDDSAVGRLQNYEIAWKMIADNPVAGVGLDKFQKASWRYLPAEYKFVDSTTVAHNTYLELAAETGIATAVAFVAISAWLLWRIRRRSPAEIPGREDLEWVRVGVFAGLVATLVNAFFADQAGTDYFWWNYGIGFACLLVVERFKAAAPAKVETPAAVPVAGAMEPVTM